MKFPGSNVKRIALMFACIQMNQCSNFILLEKKDLGKTIYSLTNPPKKFSEKLTVNGTKATE